MTVEEPAELQAQNEPYSTAQFVHALTQFALTVWRRINIVILALVVSGLLGGLYYATATRFYSAKAQLLVLQSGDDVSTSMTPQGGRQQSLMPTYENLFTSAKVVEAAIRKLPPEHRVDMAGAPRDRWNDVLQGHLAAKTIFGSNIIEIEYRSRDPGAAVAVVNAVVSAYLEFMERTHRNTAAEIIELLGNEKKELTARLIQCEERRQQLRAQLGLVGTVGTSREVLHPLVQRAVSFNEALIDAQRKKLEVQASLVSLQAALRNGEDMRQHVMELSDVVGREILLNALGISYHDVANQTELDRKLLADQAKMASLQEHCGPNHPQIVQLRDEIRLTQEYLSGYRQRINQRLAELQDGQLGPMLLGMVEQKLKDTTQKEAALSQQFESAYAEAGRLNGQMAMLEIAEFEVKWLRDLHETLLKKLADVNLRQEGSEIRAAVVSDPVMNEKPVSPRLLMVLLAVLVGGLGSGFLVVYVLDTLDDRFRSVEEVQRQLGVPVLSMVRPLTPRVDSGLEALQIYVAPDAAESEGFRTLRTALLLGERPARQIAITSTEPGDGKTTVLANLAVAFAQSDKKTLLIDGDLRRPGLTALLDMRGVEGLSGVIRGQRDVARMAVQSIRASGIEGLDVLPAGPRPANPAELLASDRFSELLAWAETVYDQVLIDSPPALAASDTALVGRLVDGVLLVVQPEKNRRRLVMRAMAGLDILKIPVLGVVVNRVGAGNESNYYGYGSGYGYEARDSDEEEETSEPGRPGLYWPDDEVETDVVEGQPSPRIPRRIA